MSGTAEERRGGPRIPSAMWVEETTGSERYYRQAGNLSKGGLRLEHTIPLPVGTIVNLTFTLPGDKSPVDISGEIVSAAAPEDLRMGVKFLDPTPDARAKIDAFLARAGACWSARLVPFTRWRARSKLPAHGSPLSSRCRLHRGRAGSVGPRRKVDRQARRACADHQTTWRRGLFRRGVRARRRRGTSRGLAERRSDLCADRDLRPRHHATEAW